MPRVGSFSRRKKQYIVLAAVLTAVVWIIAVSINLREQANLLDQSAGQAKQIAAFFERNTLGIFHYGDTYLKMIRREYIKNNDIDAIKKLMREVPLNQSIASHVTIIDETGKPLLVSGFKIKPRSTAKDRDYFLQQKHIAGDRLIVSLPHKGRNSGKLIIRMVRRFDKPNGDFGGVIFVALDASYVTDFFNALSLGPNSSATLVGLDKKIRARSSYGRLGPGQDISGSRLWRELEKNPAGLYRQLSVVDDVTRFYAYRRLADLPLVVAIGVATRDISAAASGFMLLTNLIAALVTILIISTTVLLWREVQIGQRLSASEGHIRTLIETVLDGIVSFDEQGRIRSFNTAAQKIFGYPADEIFGRSVNILTARAQPPVLESYIQNRVSFDTGGSTGNAYREVTAKRKDGAEFPAEISVGEMRNDGERLFVATVRDISEKKLAEKALFESRERAQVTLQSIGDAVISTDADGRVEFLNPVAEALTGWHANQAHGKPLSKIFRLISEETRETAQDPVERCLVEGAIVGLANHSLLISRAGNEYAIEDSAAPIRGRDGEILGVVLVFKDVTEARRLSQKVSYQASHDALTGLINRQEFERRLKRVRDTAQSEDTENVFCYLDLDQFKLVNDTGGHVAGDELLRQVSELMKSSIRQRDTLGRLGGDEFGLLMEHCSLAEARRITAQLIDNLSNYSFMWDEGRFNIGVSIGLVSIVRDSEGEDELMRAADSACYTAKESGRNRTHVYQQQDEARAIRHGEMRWAVRLPRAIEDDRFVLHYQPIVPIDGVSDPRTHHYEVLLRMDDEAGDLILPGSFLPAAERYNLATDIDKWVISRTFHWLHEHTAHLADLNLCAINLSALSLGNDAFLPFVFQQLERYQIPPWKICFEITETVAITNLTAATTFIKALKKLHCKFALDDFGSGLSSFAYLKTLPVDILKIDGLFVTDILDDPMDFAMVRSITEIGQVMGKHVVAEFVENDAILARLREIGVDYAQGFGIGRPTPFENLS